jgi:hypothetical protein
VSKRPTKSATADVVYENFLYLLAEMEFALARQKIEWTIESAEAAQRRLEKLATELRAMAAKLRIN